MSICPEKDIHSVYLDGELPQEFIAEYESHVASCSKCSAIIKKMSELNKIIQEDSDSISWTQSQLDDSFARLQVKISYNKFKNRENKSKKIKFAMQYFAAGIAAVMLISFIIPRGKSLSENQQTNFSPVARSGSSNSVYTTKIDSSLDAVHLASFLGSDNDNNQIIAIPTKEKTVAVQKMILDDCTSYNVPIVKPALADYDVFTLIDASEKRKIEEHSKGFSFSVSSPLLKVSFQVGN